MNHVCKSYLHRNDPNKISANCNKSNRKKKEEGYVSFKYLHDGKVQKYSTINLSTFSSRHTTYIIPNKMIPCFLLIPFRFLGCSILLIQYEVVYLISTDLKHECRFSRKRAELIITCIKLYVILGWYYSWWIIQGALYWTIVIRL